MPIQICSTCGTSFPDASEPPSCCPICQDERQFVPLGGQVWTTPGKLASGHVSAAVAQVTGSGLLTLRLVSLVASLVSCVLIYKLVVREAPQAMSCGRM